MAQTPYTKGTTYTIDCETVPNGDVEAMDALAVPYVWPTVAQARETVRIMTMVNRFPYSRYDTREGTVYAFTEYGMVVSVIFLERRVRVSEGIRQASRPQPHAQTWQGFSPTWGAGMAVDVYQDAQTGMWCTLVRVWNTHTGVVATNDTEWHDTFGDAHSRYSTLTAHYSAYNGR